MFGQILKRNVMKWIELPTVYLGSLLLAFSNPLRQTVGDLWAKTMVVSDEGLTAWRVGRDSPAFDQWLGSFSTEEPAGSSVKPPEERVA